MGLKKQMYRAEAKKIYKRFVENWKKAATGEALDPTKPGQMQNAQGQVVRRPTFNEWLKSSERMLAATKKQRAEAVAQVDQKLEEEFKEQKDLEWA